MLKRTSCYGCPVIFVVPQRSDVRFVSGALRFKWCPSAKKSDLFAKMKICCRCPVLLRTTIHGLLPVSWCPTWSNWHSEHHEVFVAGVLWSKWRPRAITYDLLPLCCASSCTKRRPIEGEDVHVRVVAGAFGSSWYQRSDVRFVAGPWLQPL